MEYFYECDEHGVFSVPGEVKQHHPCTICNGRCWLVAGREPLIDEAIVKKTKPKKSKAHPEE